MLETAGAVELEAPATAAGVEDVVDLGYALFQTAGDGTSPSGGV